MATFHHNLLANHASRNPRFSSVDGTKWVDFRNNVVYNWGFKSAYGGGRHGEINLVSNYYKPGPASEHHRLLDVAADGTGRYYVAGNVMVGDDRGIINTPQQVGGWPVLKKGKRLKDSDRDGMPDEWESQLGLDADNACDAATYCLDHRYTNLEVYLNHLLR